MALHGSFAPINSTWKFSILNKKIGHWKLQKSISLHMLVYDQLMRLCRICATFTRAMDSSPFVHCFVTRQFVFHFNFICALFCCKLQNSLCSIPISFQFYMLVFDQQMQLCCIYQTIGLINPARRAGYLGDEFWFCIFEFFCAWFAKWFAFHFFRSAFWISFVHCFVAK